MSFNYICIYIILYYTILYSIILYYIYYAILYSTILYYTILYSIVLYYILCYVMLWYIVLYEKSYHMYIYIYMHAFIFTYNIYIYIYATRPGVFTDTMEMQSQNLSHVIDSLKSGNHPGLATPLAPACDQICLPLLPTSYTLFTSFIDNYIDAYEYI